MGNISKGNENQNHSLYKESNCVNHFAECLFSLSPWQFSLLSSLIGILLIDNLDLDQQNSLGNFVVNIGQAILTAAAQGQVLQNSNSNKENHLRQQIQALKQQVYALEQELENFI